MGGKAGKGTHPAISTPAHALFQQFLVSISKENSTALEVLDSVSHSVRVTPDNLRLAEVRHGLVSECC